MLHFTRMNTEGSGVRVQQAVWLSQPCLILGGAPPFSAGGLSAPSQYQLRKRLGLSATPLRATHSASLRGGHTQGAQDMVAFSVIFECFSAFFNCQSSE